MTAKVISTKCPTLNEAFRKECINSSPSLEVLVSIEQDEMGVEATQIICPKYNSNTKTCNLKKDGFKCTYSIGFEDL